MHGRVLSTSTCVYRAVKNNLFVTLPPFFVPSACACVHGRAGTTVSAEKTRRKTAPAGATARPEQRLGLSTRARRERSGARPTSSTSRCATLALQVCQSVQGADAPVHAIVAARVAHPLPVREDVVYCTFHSTRRCNSHGIASHGIAGSYCAAAGLEEPTGSCNGGYYCSGGATVADPDSFSSVGYLGDTCVDRSNGTINDACPPGHYCPQGYNNTTMMFLMKKRVLLRVKRVIGW